MPCCLQHSLPDIHMVPSSPPSALCSQVTYSVRTVLTAPPNPNQLKQHWLLHSSSLLYSSTQHLPSSDTLHRYIYFIYACMSPMRS